MPNRLRTAFAILAVCALVACSSNQPASTQPGGSQASSTNDDSGPSTRPIPPDSLFAKIKIGMSYDEVVATIGKPTSEHNYQTGKAYIPFHFGSDNWRTAAHYKGVGVVTFSSDATFTTNRSVLRIDYIPEDPGFE
jgi:outer membrane protein assembly factor BamE (lipoprotein component of BamABCDE complex)